MEVAPEPGPDLKGAPLSPGQPVVELGFSATCSQSGKSYPNLR